MIKFQAANVHLQDQLYAAQKQLVQQQPNVVDVQALKKRLEDVTKALLAYRRVIHCYICTIGYYVHITQPEMQMYL